MTYNRGYGAADGLSRGSAAERNDVTGMRQSVDSRSGTTSLIDRDSYFNGTYRSPHDLRVEGEFEGEIHCEGTVVVAEHARVSGTINAGSVLISGSVAGQVTCGERFEVLSTGQVTATVLAGTVVVREGAYYEGEMRMHQEPDGLPQREYSGGAAPTPIQTAFAASAHKAPGVSGSAAGAEAERMTNGVVARDLAEPSALRTVTEG